MRRLRGKFIQPLFKETTLSVTDLVAPLFIDETIGNPEAIVSMPGQFRYPVSMIAGKAGTLYDSGVHAVLLFGVPARKDNAATGAHAKNGVIQQAVREIKAHVPEIVVITDVCACEYTNHGHCGIISDGPCGPDLDNDTSLALMNRIAVSHAESGADIVAPSCMLDGMVHSIRAALDDAGFTNVAIMVLDQVRKRPLRAVPGCCRFRVFIRRPDNIPDGSRECPRSLARIATRRG